VNYGLKPPAHDLKYLGTFQTSKTHPAIEIGIEIGIEFQYVSIAIAIAIAISISIAMAISIAMGQKRGGDYQILPVLRQSRRFSQTYNGMFHLRRPSTKGRPINNVLVMVGRGFESCTGGLLE
jgi:hypothetical protein